MQGLAPSEVAKYLQWEMCEYSLVIVPSKSLARDTKSPGLTESQ